MSEPGSLRRSMAWIHGWLGLLAGWILFTMFLTGTASYFRPEITRWMQPERHGLTVSSAEATAAAVRYLQSKDSDDERWTIFLPSDRDPETKAYARPKGTTKKPSRLILEPVTGLPLVARDTHGGELLYEFHYSLQLPAPWGIWIAGLCALAMLGAIISGVITHKRIFADFFTMRWDKGQRSWLDGHNLAAVLGLPYHFIITYSGLITLATIYMPWPVKAQFATTAAYSAAAFPDDTKTVRTGRHVQMVPVNRVVADAERRLGDPASSVTIRYPGDAGSVITVTGRSGAALTAKGPSLSYSGKTGALLAKSKPAPSGVATNATLFGLHLGYFAGPTMRWLLFLFGLGGTAMVGSGLILWTVKRERQNQTLGHRLTHRLNIISVACFPAAIAVYFLANRFIPASAAGRATGETWALFGTWATLSVVACLLPVRRAWTALLAAGALLYLAVPVADLAIVGAPRDGLFLGFDAAMVIASALLAFASRRIARPTAPGLRVRTFREHTDVVA